MLAVMALVLGGLVAAAAAQDTPPTVPGAKTVTAEQVKALLAKGGRIYDFRKKAAYAEKHIPGAVHARYDEKSVKAASYEAAADTFDLSQLPSDRSAVVILHGHGTDGWKGYKATRAAVKAGYLNAYFFRGGFAEWVAKGLGTE